VRTDGSRIVLADGRELIDGIASWWTACHGYNHPHIRDAVRRQLDILPHVMFGGLAHEPAYTLARRLAGLLPGDLDHVFFAESGSVAVEVAMKMAVQYWLNRGVRGRTRFVAFRGGYHGDTMATMAVCDPEEGMHRLFAGLLPEHVLVDLPRDEESTDAFERVLERHADELAGILVEPLVQGAGGMLFPMRPSCAVSAKPPTATICSSSSTRFLQASDEPEPCSPARRPAWFRTSSRSPRRSPAAHCRSRQPWRGGRCSTRSGRTTRCTP